MKLHLRTNTYLAMADNC